jgi:hypothetical protein
MKTNLQMVKVQQRFGETKKGREVDKSMYCSEERNECKRHMTTTLIPVAADWLTEGYFTFLPIL